MSEWIAYSNIEPFGERNRDAYFGMLSATVASAPHLKRPKKPYTYDNFMLKTPAELIKTKVKSSTDIVKEIFHSLNKKIKGK